jgi:hypothetical protein
MTFMEYDKMMTNFHQGLKYWNSILENYHEWERLKTRLDPLTGLPMSVNWILLMDNHCTDDDINNELKMTAWIAVSTPMYKEMGLKWIHIQNTDKDKDTAYDIRAALREQFENINPLGLTKLMAKFYNVVEMKVLTNGLVT